MSDQTAQPNTDATFMPEESISVTDLASQLGKQKQTVSYLTAQESRLVAVELRSARSVSRLGDAVVVSPEALPDQHGVFYYLLLLEPEHDPGRFKVGFAISLPERLRTLRCSAPLTKVARLARARCCGRRPPLTASRRAASSFIRKCFAPRPSSQ